MTPIPYTAYVISKNKAKVIDLLQNHGYKVDETTPDEKLMSALFHFGKRDEKSYIKAMKIHPDREDILHAESAKGYSVVEEIDDYDTDRLVDPDEPKKEPEKSKPFYQTTWGIVGITAVSTIVLIGAFKAIVK